MTPIKRQRYRRYSASVGSFPLLLYAAFRRISSSVTCPHVHNKPSQDSERRHSDYALRRREEDCAQSVFPVTKAVYFASLESLLQTAVEDLVMQDNPSYVEASASNSPHKQSQFQTQ